MVGRPKQVYNVVPLLAIIPEGADWEDYLWESAGDEKIISGDPEESDFLAWDSIINSGQWNQRYYDRIVNGYSEPLEIGDNLPYLSRIISSHPKVFYLLHQKFLFVDQHTLQQWHQ